MLAYLIENSKTGEINRTFNINEIKNEIHLNDKVFNYYGKSLDGNCLYKIDKLSEIEILLKDKYTEECYNCEGTGEVTCGKCDGDEFILCEKCEGKGIIINNEKEEKCEDCNGIGDFPCDNCDDGKECCPECDGYGWEWIRGGKEKYKKEIEDFKLKNQENENQINFNFGE